MSSVILALHIKRKRITINDKFHGEWVYYKEDGTRSMIINWLYGEEHGISMHYLKRNLHSKMNFENGLKDGELSIR